MFTNKYLNLGYFSVFFIFGIAMNTAIVKADSSLQSNSDFTLLKINDEFSTTQEHEQAEENTEKEDLEAEELEGLEEYEISINGMTCANCETKVKGALLKCSGVKTAWVSHIEGSAVIEADTDMIDVDQIVAAIEKAGFVYLEEE
ncbi:heavy metal transporting ATPase [Candidatus Scalindua japonica]|uniref:Heavy metal transporting ATPase n=1 Tax=Candidatus Scalindua japonica TaxID=1284222 RepID=A0A286U3C3_9BACT|nr:cation transporter [Candidatus Scalindua japonica]GAX62624.1 heavy metal transporting ATPase [Candidatus Scalindua japonica]